MAPQDFYQGQSKFLISVDCVILGFFENEIKLLTFKRKIEPNIGEMSLLGGFMKGGEDIGVAASRVLKDLTGLENLYVEQVGAYGNVDRDPGERVISVAYFALIYLDEDTHKFIEKSDSTWIPLGERNKLIFDHKQMVDDAIRILRQRAALHPIGFNLLPERFTLTQLQTLYESIYEERLDKRNFRKKILAMNVLDRLDEKDKINSKRGAYYFVFNEEKYNAMLRKGNVFAV